METNSAPIDKHQNTDEVYDRMIELWTLRLMVAAERLPGIREVRDSQADYILELLGLSDMVGPQNRRTLRAFIRQRLQALEKDLPIREGVLFRNLRRLGDRIGLNGVEQDLLAFSVLWPEHRLAKPCCEYIGELNARRWAVLLAGALSHDVSEIHKAIHKGSVLAKTGLFYLMPYSRAEVACYFTVLSGLDRLLLTDDLDPSAILNEFLLVEPQPRLDLYSFPHLLEDIVAIRSLLAEAMSQRLKGMNILLYGSPGVGKTELVRALAGNMGVRLYKVGSKLADGTDRVDEDRFQAFQLSQALLAGDNGSMIVFDEIEDVFSSSSRFIWGTSSSPSQSKAWINTTLETNPVPTLWLSNHTRQIDPAFLRRFTYVAEIPNPPESVRRCLLKATLRELPVREQWVESVAKNPQVTPALTQQIGAVARLIGPMGSTATERLMQRVIRNSLEVMGQSFDVHCAGESIEYRLDLLNTTPDAQGLVDGLTRSPQGRLCLYGPPGTGKSALADHLAHRLDKPLIKRSASDLLSKWVGETEKAYASMFREAEREGAVLLLDEADSFLYDRRSVQQSWQVTQVNELLVRMEAFEGIFLCSTNLMDTLDSAVLRRFDVKVRFEYLTAAQAWTMLLQVLAVLDESHCPKRIGVETQQRLARLRNLTPGDFAVVLRKGRILGTHWDDEHVLAALEEESQAKHHGSKPVSGFIGG